MSILFLAGTITFTGLVVVCIVAFGRGDHLERQLGLTAAARDYWKSKALSAQAYNEELLQAVAKENQDKLLAKLRLQRLMARYWFSLVSSGAAGLLVDDHWQALTRKEKSYWRQRAQELLESGTDEKPARDVMACSDHEIRPFTESESEAA